MELVNEFNGNDVPVFLVSLKAGGTGLNLTGASVVIHADPWWNAAAQQQAGRREFFSFMGVYSGEPPLPPLFFCSMAGIDSGDEIPAVPGQ